MNFQEKKQVVETINATIGNFQNDRQKAYLYVDLIQYLARQAEQIFRDEFEAIKEDDFPNYQSFADAKESVDACQEINRLALLKTHPYVIR